MISAGVPFAESHRHYSHLLMIFPLYVMNPDQPENRELITRSVDHWMGMPAALRGYSYTGASSISASLGRGDDAVKYLEMFVDGGGNGRYPCLPNTMYAEAGPVIETPLSGARSLQDILLQSWGGMVRVFPAVPDSWKDATIADMRTEGAFLVTAVKTGGQTRLIKIKSEASEPLRVKTDMHKPTASVDGKAIELKATAPGLYEIPLQKGQTVVILPKTSANEPPPVAPVADQANRRNSFGLR
jgi:hypothetical protein